MTAVVCRNAADRSATSWHGELARFKALEFAVSDAAKGIASGLDRLARDRHSLGDATPLTQGLDLFHTTRDAETVLGRSWRRAEAAWLKAETLDAEIRDLQRRGLNAQGRGQTRTVAWRRAVALLEQVEGQQRAWRRARQALEPLDPEGRLNHRARAITEIAAACAALIGPEWATVRSFLSDPRSTSFLDRLHQRLVAAEPRASWREAMAWRWWGRHRRPLRPTAPGGALVRSVAWGRPLVGAERVS